TFCGRSTQVTHSARAPARAEADPCVAAARAALPRHGNGPALAGTAAPRRLVRRRREALRQGGRQRPAVAPSPERSAPVGTVVGSGAPDRSTAASGSRACPASPPSTASLTERVTVAFAGAAAATVPVTVVTGPPSSSTTTVTGGCVISPPRIEVHNGSASDPA